MDLRQQKLDAIIEVGKNRVSTVLNDIQAEFESRRDMIVKPDALHFRVKGEIRTHIRGDALSSDLGFTGFAHGQLLARAGVPVAYANKLLDLGESELLINNINTMINRNCSDGLLFRRIGETVKGVLSPAYRRMDAAPIFQGFIESAIGAGYVPYNGAVTDYRYNLAFILPEVFQPADNEFIVLGIAITTSDYGSSALQVELLALRITCLNLCMGTDVMRSVHIGKRFDTTQDLIQLSNQTHDLDNKAVASAVSDAVKSSIDLQSGVRNRISLAMSENSVVNIADEVKKLRQKGIKKELAESVKAVYESPAPVELLPVHPGKWRLSNAISLVAGSDGVASDIRIDLQKQAFSVLA